MVAVLSILIFSGACATAIAAITATIAPEWRRIVRLMSGEIEEQFAPLSHIAKVERRIAVRRWASDPVPAPIARLRVAA